MLLITTRTDLAAAVVICCCQYLTTFGRFPKLDFCKRPFEVLLYLSLAEWMKIVLGHVWQLVALSTVFTVGGRSARTEVAVL